MTEAPEALSRLAEFYADPGEASALAESALRRLEALRAGSGKTCSSCGERKALTAFHADRRRPDGLRSICRSCRSV